MIYVNKQKLNVSYVIPNCGLCDGHSARMSQLHYEIYFWSRSSPLWLELEVDAMLVSDLSYQGLALVNIWTNTVLPNALWL